MQYRNFNYLDDDSTFQLNWKDLIINPHGLYAGFDPVLGTGRTLTLNHATTGVTKVDLAGAETDPMGCWKSKQGVVICEDGDITLTIAANGSAHPRIDLIVGQHEYIETSGGVDATYIVIQGTPGATPVAPALTYPEKQIILGQLFLPAAYTNLSDTDVVYTRSMPPSYGSDATVMHTDREQTSTALKIFEAYRGHMGTAKLSGVYSTTGDPDECSLIVQTKGNVFELDTENLSPDPFLDLMVFYNGCDLGAGAMYHFFTSVPLTVWSSGTSKFAELTGEFKLQEAEIRIPAYSVFTVHDLGDMGTGYRRAGITNVRTLQLANGDIQDVEITSPALDDVLANDGTFMFRNIAVNTIVGRNLLRMSKTLHTARKNYTSSGSVTTSVPALGDLMWIPDDTANVHRFTFTPSAGAFFSHIQGTQAGTILIIETAIGHTPYELKLDGTLHSSTILPIKHIGSQGSVISPNYIPVAGRPTILVNMGDYWRIIDDSVELYNTHADITTLSTTLNTAISETAWIGVTLGSNWSVYSGSSVGYKKTGLDWVHLRGTIEANAGTLQTPIFTLPTFFRPAQACIFSVNLISGSSIHPIVLGISTAGAVTWNDGAHSITNGDYFSIDGIFFKV